MDCKQYYFRLLEGRAKRLNELLEIAAPENLICNEVLLILKAAVILSPRTFMTEHDDSYKPPKIKQEKDQREQNIRLRNNDLRTVAFLMSKMGNKLRAIRKYYDCSQDPDFDNLHHNIAAAETYLELAHEELEEILDEDHTQRLIEDVGFWRQLSELGIVIFQGPRPFKEEQKCWFLSKHSTLIDHGKDWTNTYPTLKDAVEAAYKYWADGERPEVFKWPEEEKEEIG